MKKGKNILANTVVAGALVMQAATSNAQTGPSVSATSTPLSDESIHPYKVNIPQGDLDELRRRVVATRWPGTETVKDQSQGAQLDKLQKLVHYWGTDYNWRKVEARLNSLPQFMTKIDGVDIYFIQVRSHNPSAMPLLVLHGWPGSVIEQLKIIGPLTDPVAYGGKAEDAFDLVIPALPGYGFSSQPTEAGWGPDRIGVAMDILMKRLAYDKYVVQGGDWGSVIAEAMGGQAPSGMLGLHINLPAAIPPDIEKALGGPAPPGISEEERTVFNALNQIRKSGGLTYSLMMGARPQAVGYGLTDSPAGLAAFLLVHPGFDKWSFGSDPQQSPTKDDVLDDFTLYWLTNSATSSARIYWETRGKNVIGATSQKTADIHVPVAITVFPDDIYCAPESWARRSFPNLTYYHRVDKGGHFAAWEQPQLFSEELRAAFRSLR